MSESQTPETPKKTTGASLADLKDLTQAPSELKPPPKDNSADPTKVTIETTTTSAHSTSVAVPNDTDPQVGAEADHDSAHTEEIVVEITPVVIDSKGRNYAGGGRKEASARVWLMPGKGDITVNRRPLSVYFSRSVLQMIIRQPFALVEREGQYDVFATVRGGGKSGQAGAVRHGIAHALVHREPELRTVIKKGGLLTRDSRTVERKKYGLRKARRSFQFSKR